MALRFAPAARPGRSPVCAPVAKALAGRAIERVANDNHGKGGALPVGHSSNDHLLRAALRHFGQHGIGAARDARERAEKAFFDGDRPTYDWWLGVTRTLDRRLADGVTGFGN